MMEECLFCKIIQKKIPAEIVFENGQVLCFRDINPQAPVHILIIPKKHIPSLMNMGAGEGGLLEGLYSAIQHLAREEGVHSSGFRLVVNNGPAAGQAVSHLHFHLLGGRTLSWPPG